MATSNNSTRPPQGDRPPRPGPARNADTPAPVIGTARPRRRKRRTNTGCMTCLTILSFVFIGSIVVMLIVAGWAFAFISQKTKDLPNLENVVLPPAKETTKIFASNGVKLADLYVENRVYAKIDEIPGHLQEAFIGIEDERFYQHNGVDFQGGMRAAYELFKTGKKGQGASTITMQLARNLHISNLSTEKTWTRKFKEILVALALERKYTKQQILEHYLNQVFFGHGAYGVRTAAEIYFGKQMKDLTIAECAMLAAVVKGPSVYSPFFDANRQRAWDRRNTVLKKMFDLHFISSAEYMEAVNEEVKLVRLKGPSYENYVEPFFVTYVIDQLEDENGPYQITPQQLITEGYKIYTTLDIDMQQHADMAVQGGVVAANLYLAPNKSGQDGAVLGYAMSRDVAILGMKSDKEYNQFLDKSISEYCDACSVGAKDAGDGLCGELLTNLKSLTSLKSSGKCYARGDKKIISMDAIRHARETALSKVRVQQGALNAVDVHNGQILAMVGGVDYKENKFNHAWQAERQPGSSFKPFTYLTALQQGYSMESSVVNGGGCVGTWCPVNYGGSHGNGSYVSFAHALINSLNIPAVRVGQFVGTDKIIALCRELGITGHMESTPSLPLGTASISPMQMSLGYAAISNGGYKVSPVFIKEIRNASGAPIVKNEPKGLGKQVLNNNTIASIIPVMQNVIRMGTGTRAKFGRPEAGKTGTTSSFKDAWFVGYTPDVAAAVWIGNDNNAPLCTTIGSDGSCRGTSITGGFIPAPIWRDFMKHASRIRGYKDFDLPEKTSMQYAHVGGGGRPREVDAEGGEAGGTGGGGTEGVEAGAVPGAQGAGPDTGQAPGNDSTRTNVYENPPDANIQDRELNNNRPLPPDNGNKKPQPNNQGTKKGAGEDLFE